MGKKFGPVNGWRDFCIVLKVGSVTSVSAKETGTRALSRSNTEQSWEFS